MGFCFLSSFVIKTLGNKSSVQELCLSSVPQNLNQMIQPHTLCSGPRALSVCSGPRPLRVHSSPKALIMRSGPKALRVCSDIYPNGSDPLCPVPHALSVH